MGQTINVIGGLTKRQKGEQGNRNGVSLFSLVWKDDESNARSENGTQKLRTRKLGTEEEVLTEGKRRRSEGVKIRRIGNSIRILCILIKRERKRRRTLREETHKSVSKE